MSGDVVLNDYQYFDDWVAGIEPFRRNFNPELETDNEVISHCLNFPHFNEHAISLSCNVDRLRTWHDVLHTRFEKLLFHLIDSFADDLVVTLIRKIPPEVNPREESERIRGMILRNHYKHLIKRFVDVGATFQLQELQPNTLLYILEMLDKSKAQRRQKNRQLQEDAIKRALDLKPERALVTMGMFTKLFVCFAMVKLGMKLLPSALTNAVRMVYALSGRNTT